MMKKIKELFKAKSVFWSGGVLGTATLLSGCVTTDYAGSDRYARLYDACDAQAGACYRSCDDFSSDSDRALCQDDCSIDADRCFADLNSLIRKESLYELTRDNFYGRYGAWYPGQGYRYGSHGYSYRYPYRYRGYYYSPQTTYDEPDDDRGEYEVRRSTGKPNKPNPRKERVPTGRQEVAPSYPVERSTGRSQPSPKTRVTPPPRPTKPTGSKPTPRPQPQPSAKPQPRPKAPPKVRRDGDNRNPKQHK